MGVFVSPSGASPFSLVLIKVCVSINSPEIVFVFFSSPVSSLIIHSGVCPLCLSLSVASCLCVNHCLSCLSLCCQVCYFVYHFQFRLMLFICVVLVFWFGLDVVKFYLVFSCVPFLYQVISYFLVLVRLFLHSNTIFFPFVACCTIYSCTLYGILIEYTSHGSRSLLSPSLLPSRLNVRG